MAHATRNFPDMLPATQEILESWYISYWPAGSGPLAMMRLVCAALEEIAELRGYDTNFVELRKTAFKGSVHGK